MHDVLSRQTASFRSDGPTCSGKNALANFAKRNRRLLPLQSRGVCGAFVVMPEAVTFQLPPEGGTLSRKRCQPPLRHRLGCRARGCGCRARLGCRARGCGCRARSCGWDASGAASIELKRCSGTVQSHHQTIVMKFQIGCSMHKLLGPSMPQVALD